MVWEVVPEKAKRLWELQVAVEYFVREARRFLPQCCVWKVPVRSLGASPVAMQYDAGCPLSPDPAQGPFVHCLFPLPSHPDFADLDCIRTQFHGWPR